MSTQNICFHAEIRKKNEVLLMSTQNICFHAEIRKKNEVLLMSTLNICFHAEIKKKERGASNEYPKHMFSCRNKKKE